LTTPVPSYEDLQILGILFTSYITPHTTLGNEQCLKLLLVVCNTEGRCDLSISLYGAGAGDDEVELESTTRHQEIFPSI
jgi:hypothetical protein